MTYEIKILRCKKGTGKQYTQSFLFEGTGEETVSAVLDRFNTKDDLFDKDGKPADKIIWSCSCNQGICGACSMVINGTPLLACKTKLNSLKGHVVTLAPLTKFPLIADLETDRSGLYEAPIAHGIWNEGRAEISARRYALEYEASKCMKCGICVEVCPNADGTGINAGAVFAVDCYLKWAQSGDKAVKKKIKTAYRRNFSNSCSKAMSCEKYCPAKIDIRSLICQIK